MAKVDISKLAQRLAELNSNNNSGSSSSMNFLTINDGRNVVRVLPPVDEDKMFYEEVWVHYGVGKTKENKNGTMVVCPTTHKEGAKCPVCELSSEFKKLSNKKDDSYDKQARAIYRKKRVYFNAINREEDLSVFEYQGEGEDAKWVNTKTGEDESPVKVWGAGVGIFKAILALIVDPEYGDVTDADEGLDLIVTKTGSGQFNTKYDVKTVRKNTDIGFPEWESAVNDLSQLTKAKTYEEIAKIMLGEEEDTPEPTDDEIKEALSNMEDKSSSTDEEETKPSTQEDTSSSEEDDVEAEIRAAILARKNKQ